MTVEIDKNDFFRQATIRICGSLDISVALERTVRYLGSFIPATSICLQLFREDLNAIETVADVDLDQEMNLDRIIPMPEETVGKLEARWQNMRKVRIINNPEDFPETRIITELLERPDLSIMGMRLELEGERIGFIVIAAHGKNRYTYEHSDLLHLLHEPFAIAMSNAMRYRELLQLKERLEDDNLYLHRELLRISGDEIIGAEFGLRDVMDMVRQVSALNSPVLLVGETGVGKEVIANAIHYSSQRREGPFIKVNCGAIPDSLVDSELFGHEKGAFTGAINMKRGRFERAAKGTVFLDEIGELPLQAQIRLLRVIQNREIERVGGTKTIPVDVRIISATHRNLEEMVRAGTFREDLLFRINVFPITIPPLRQRSEDIPALVNHFVHKKAKELRLSSVPEISGASVESLKNYVFRGNVRELENMVERALIRHGGGKVSFSIPGDNQFDDSLDFSVETGQRVTSLEEMNRIYIEKVLNQASGKIHGPGGAAELLDIHPNTLRKRMDRLGIEYKKRNRLK